MNEKIERTSEFDHANIFLYNPKKGSRLVYTFKVEFCFRKWKRSKKIEIVHI